MANTAKLGLPKITDNMSADVVRDINALADGIDAKVGVPGGLATLDENGNVGGVDTSKLATKDEVATHKNEKASLTAYGHTQLSSATNSDSETLAATPKAVKAAMDRADAAFQSASNGKAVVSRAIAGADPTVVIPTDPTFQQLADAVGAIETGIKFASGIITSASSTKTFNNQNGNDISSAYVVLDLSKITFSPKLIYLNTVDKGSGIISVWTKDNQYQYASGAYWANVIVQRNMFRDYKQGYLLYIPVGSIDTSYSWVAYE